MKERARVESPAAPTNPFAAPERSRSPIVGGGVSPHLHHVFRQLFPAGDFRLRAKGGEQLIVEFEDLPETGSEFRIGERTYRKDALHPQHEVYKVDYAHTLQAMQYLFLAESEDQLQEAERHAIRHLRGVAKLRKDQLRLLAQPEYLGAEAIPKERYFIRDVPVSRSLIDAVEPGLLKKEDRVPEHAPTLIVAQERFDLDPEEKYSVSLTAGYPEARAAFRAEIDEGRRAIYATVHNLCIGKDAPEIEADDQKRLIRAVFPRLVPAAERLKQDAEFARCLHETVHRLIQTVQHTGLALDLAGMNNLVLLQPEYTNDWKLKAIDVLPQDAFETIDELKKVIAFIQAGQELGDMAIHAQNCMQTIRVVNALAILCGSSERLRVSELDQVPAETWRTLFVPLHKMM